MQPSTNNKNNGNKSNHHNLDNESHIHINIHREVEMNVKCECVTAYERFGDKAVSVCVSVTRLLDEDPTKTQPLDFDGAVQIQFETMFFILEKIDCMILILKQRRRQGCDINLFIYFH